MSGTSMRDVCFLALDRHVVAGRADETALVDGAASTSYAVLLEQVGALAGALRLIGVAPGDRVALRGLGAREALLAELACLRLGATAVLGEDGEVTFAVTDDVGAHPAARATILVGPTEPRESVDAPWGLAVNAGRTAPAECVPVPADTVLLVEGGSGATADELAAGSVRRAWTPLLEGVVVELG